MKQKAVAEAYYHAVRRQYNLDCNILARLAMKQARESTPEGKLLEHLKTLPVYHQWQSLREERAVWLSSHYPTNKKQPQWEKAKQWAIKQRDKGIVDAHEIMSTAIDRFMLPFYTSQQQLRVFCMFEKLKFLL